MDVPDTEFEPEVPIGYAISRSLTPELVSWAIGILRMTPIQCALVTDSLDAELAKQFSDTVYAVRNIEDAHTVAQQINATTGQPALIVGDALLFDAVFADGTRKAFQTYAEK